MYTVYCRLKALDLYIFVRGFLSGLITEGAYNWNRKSALKQAIAVLIDQNTFFIYSFFVKLLNVIFVNSLWGRGGIIGCIVLFTGRRAYNWGKRWWGLSVGRGISGGLRNQKQLLGEVFVISGIIKVEVSKRLITLTETLIISQKPNLSIVLLYIVLKHITTNTPI